MKIQYRSSSFKNTWSIWEEEMFINLRTCVEGAGILVRVLQQQSSWWLPFLSPTSQHKCIASCGNQHSTNTLYLIWKFCVSIPFFSESNPYSQDSSAGPTRDLAQTLVIPCLQTLCSTVDLPTSIYSWLEATSITGLAVCKLPNRSKFHSEGTPTWKDGKITTTTKKE